MMMKNKIFFLYCLILVFSLNSCQKETFSTENIWDCHQDQTWTERSTFDELIGEWEWEYISCFWSHDQANDEEFAGLTVEFNADSTLTVREDGTITQTATWIIEPVDGDLLGVTTTPIVSQLYGRVLICKRKETIEFNDSYIDGCDNFFSRID